MADIDPCLLADIVEYAMSLNPGDALSPKVLRAIARHSQSRMINHSVETGTGGSTLLFSHLSKDHTVFTINSESRIIERIQSSHLFNGQTTTFIEGPTQSTLPNFVFSTKIQAALLDGPHAFPFPQLEYFYLYSHLDAGALLIVDDLQIPSVNDLFRFLKAEEMFSLIDVIERTAFFERTQAPAFDRFSDGWLMQGYNRVPLLRYAWKESLRRAVPGTVRQAVKKFALDTSALMARARGSKSGWVKIQEPDVDAVVGPTAMVRGQAEIPGDAFLWLFARRADVEGWWPQGGSAARIQGLDWEQICKFGEPQDAGQKFEIALVVLDQTANSRLLRWQDEAERSGSFPQMQLPACLAWWRPLIRRVSRR